MTEVKGWSSGFKLRVCDLLEALQRNALGHPLERMLKLGISCMDAEFF